MVKLGAKVINLTQNSLFFVNYSMESLLIWTFLVTLHALVLVM